MHPIRDLSERKTHANHTLMSKSRIPFHNAVVCQGLPDQENRVERMVEYRQARLERGLS